MTALYLARKLLHECTDCGRDAAPDAQLCAECATAKRDHQRRCMAQLRDLRRDNGLCAECGRTSATYRCRACRPRQISTSRIAA